MPAAREGRLVIRAGEPVEPGRYDEVLVLVRDRAELRALALPKGVRTAEIGVRVEQSTSVLSLTPRPEWPVLQVIDAREMDGAWLTVLRFASPAPVHAVVRELGRQSVWPDRAGDRGLVVGHTGNDKVPADVVLADWHLTAGEADHPVTGHPPLVLTHRDSPAPLGPIDERVFNPIGFVTDPTGPVVDLPADAVPTEALVRGLRSALGVTVTGREVPAPLLAGLAMAGVPLVSTELAPEVRGALGDAVADAVTAPVDLDDPMAREEHSVVLRRAALTTYSSFAWRRELGALAGVRVHWQPSVSVVMATRRPDLLEHAVSQVARQRGVESLELVLAPHGWDADPARVRDLAGPSVAVQVAPQTESVLFGDVLNHAAEAAGGHVVLKMDDDDWYSPDFVADLLLARAYSGADLVGMPDDWYYLGDRDLTVRLDQPSEVYRGFVAGGTMLLAAGLLREVGGFRSVHRHVDAQLLYAVRSAGAATYRTHGLGYCLRRTTTGHTWDADLDELESRAVATRPGFRPSRLMEL